MLNENVKKLLKENMWDLATCSASVPNVVPVALKDVTDDGKLVVGDVFLGTTLRNLAANGAASQSPCTTPRHLRATRSGERPSTSRTGRSWPCSRPWSSRCFRARPRRRARWSSRRRPSSSRRRRREQESSVTAHARFLSLFILLFLTGGARGYRNAARARLSHTLEILETFLRLVYNILNASRG